MEYGTVVHVLDKLARRHEYINHVIKTNVHKVGPNAAFQMFSYLWLLPTFPFWAFDPQQATKVLRPLFP